jgi:hypothetical protein
MKPLLFLLFLVPGIQLFAQHYIELNPQHYTIAGYVVSPHDVPIPWALLEMETGSAKTNSNGYFTIETTVLPGLLTVHSNGYPDKEQLVNMPPLGYDTIFVTIRMEDKQTDLEEVRITSDRAIWAYPKKNVHIIDFDLYNDGMLLLCKDHNEYLLRWVNELSEPIFDLPIRDHPKNFFRGCSGSDYIVYRDSVYEIELHNNSLKLINGTSVLQLQRTFGHCVSAIADKQVYRYWGDYHQCVEFFTVDTLTYKRKSVYLAEDRKYMRVVYATQLEAQREHRTSRDPAQQAQELKERMDAAKRNQKAWEQLLVHEAYIPVYRLRDSIVVFDHLNDSAIVLDANGRRLRTYPIIYQHHKRWDYELIMNEEGTRIFARYDYGGMAHLLEIDPNNGEILREVRLDQHIYPIKIQVRGNFIYYIYHFYVDNSINYIYKQRIE